MASGPRLLIPASTGAGALAGWLLAPPASVPFALPAGLILWFLACAAILVDFAGRLGQRPGRHGSGGR
jgi:hypothetical protein